MPVGDGGEPFAGGDVGGAVPLPGAAGVGVAAGPGAEWVVAGERDGEEFVLGAGGLVGGVPAPEVGGEAFEWEAGYDSPPGSRLRVPYLIGTPRPAGGIRIAVELPATAPRAEDG